jgi:hypothetical protein
MARRSINNQCSSMMHLLPSPIRFMIIRPGTVVFFSGDMTQDMKRVQQNRSRLIGIRQPPRSALVNEQGTLDAICCVKWDMLNWRYVHISSVYSVRWFIE